MRRFIFCVNTQFPRTGKLICKPNTSYSRGEIVYTDGSMKKDYLGLGVWYEDNDPRNKSYKIMGWHDSNRAELAGIYAAIVSSADKDILEVNTDSAVSIRMITEKFYDNKFFGRFDPLLSEIGMLVQERNNPTVLSKVKSHPSVVGNTKADQLAGSAQSDTFLVLPDNTMLEILHHIDNGDVVVYPSEPFGHVDNDICV